MSFLSTPRFPGPRVGRRSLLAAAGAGGLAATIGLPGAAHAGPDHGHGDLTNPENWRRLFVLDRDPLFMNVGTVGSPPRDVLDAEIQELRLVAQQALSNYHGTFPDVRGQIAPGLG